MGKIKLPIYFSPHRYNSSTLKGFWWWVFLIWFVGFCCCFFVYCGLVFVVGFFFDSPSTEKARSKTISWCQCSVENVYSFLWWKFLLYGNRTVLQAQHHRQSIFPFDTVVSVSPTASQGLMFFAHYDFWKWQRSGWLSLLCAQVPLNSCGHTSLWGHSRIKTHIPETDLSISMASCNAILCRMAHHASEVMVSTFGLHRIYRKPSRVKNVTLIISIVWGFFGLFICLGFFLNKASRGSPNAHKKNSD